MSKWRLYWVSTPSPDEDCFVIARNARSAASYEEGQSGFNPGNAQAELILRVPDNFEKIVLKKHRNWLKEQGNHEEARKKNLKMSPNYADKWLLLELGAQLKEIDGRDVTIINGRHYSPATWDEVYGNRKPALIKSVAELSRRVAQLPQGKWLFRGHSNSLWELKCSLDREPTATKWQTMGRLKYEKLILEQFKLRAMPYISTSSIQRMGLASVSTASWVANSTFGLDNQSTGCTLFRSS